MQQGSFVCTTCSTSNRTTTTTTTNRSSTQKSGQTTGTFVANLIVRQIQKSDSTNLLHRIQNGTGTHGGQPIVSQGQRFHTQFRWQWYCKTFSVTDGTVVTKTITVKFQGRHVCRANAMPTIATTTTTTVRAIDTVATILHCRTSHRINIVGKCIFIPTKFRFGHTMVIHNGHRRYLMCTTFS